MLSLCVYAAEDKQMTFGLSNGRAWAAFSPEMKIAWVTGWLQGVETTITTMNSWTGHSTHDGKLAIDVFIPNLTVGEITQQIERFYSDSLNMPIPITSATWIVNMRAQGVAPEKVEAEIRRYRTQVQKADETQ
jgi:hypothetical protein